MSQRLLALEWDAKEARVAVGRAKGGTLVVEQAFAIELPKRQGDAAGDEKEIGAAIAVALSQRGLAKSDAIVAVGRANIELRFLTTPPTPPEELPDLVRFQAMRQFTTLGDEWPLDFVPLEENRDGGINVLAAAIAPDLVRQIRDTCHAAGVNCAKLVLRPFATAALHLQSKTEDRCRMLVDLLSDEADLTVMAGGKVIFPRTIRLPAADGGEAQARALLGEIRRTVIAAQNQLGGRKVEQVVIFGDEKHHASLRKLIEDELTLEAGVELFDPLAHVELEGEARRQRPEYPGTFAPLLGMLAEEAAPRPQPIDFLHPRKRPQPPDYRRTYAIAGGAAAAVAALLLFMLWWQLAGQGSQARQLQNQINQQDRAAKAGKATRDQAAKLDRFARGDISWLDELRTMSINAPPADKVKVADLLATVSPQGGGEITIQAQADDNETIRLIEQRLTETGRLVQGKGLKREAKSTGPLPFKFDLTVHAIPTAERQAMKDAGSPSDEAPPAGEKTTGKGKQPAKAPPAKEKQT